MKIFIAMVLRMQRKTVTAKLSQDRKAKHIMAFQIKVKTGNVHIYEHIYNIMTNEKTK